MGVQVFSTTSFFSELCWSIKTCSIPKWYFTIKVGIEDLESKELDIIFHQVDCLALNFIASESSYRNNYSFLRFLSLKAIKNREKVLELDVNIEQIQFDLGKILSRCWSIKVFTLTKSSISNPQDEFLQFAQSSNSLSGSFLSNKEKKSRLRGP